MAGELLNRLQEDVKQAMRGGDTLARDTLRMCIAGLKNREIELGRSLEGSEELAVLHKAVKTREESAAQFDAAGRGDLAGKERGEIAVVQRYLPRQLGEPETRALVASTIARLGLSAKKDLGALMKVLMAERKGEIDGKLVQRVAGELLK
jgi:uncharacterized protein YqeY